MSAHVTPPRSAAPTMRFAAVLESTPQAARRARNLATRALAIWGWPRDGDVSRTAALIVAELTANAITHGRVEGSAGEFRLALAVLSGAPGPARLRVEVTDTCGNCVPQPSPHTPDAVSGRGLLLVAALSDRWGWAVEGLAAKTVWAELTADPPGAETHEPC